MAKQPKHPKSPEARRAEVQHLTDQLGEVGLPDEVTAPLVADLKEFAETGQGVSRVLKVPATPIAIAYLLSNQAHITSYIRIVNSAKAAAKPT